MDDPYRQPPSRLSAFGAVWLTFLCLLGGFACLHLTGLVWARATGGTLQEASLAMGRLVEVTTLCQLAAMGATLWLCLRVAAEPGRTREALGLAPVPALGLALLFAAGLCLQLPLAELANLLREHVLGPQSIEEQRRILELIAPASLPRRLLAWACLGALVPLMEEWLFRGGLLTGLVPTQQRAGAVVVSAALFGLCHVEAAAIVYAFVAGLGLGAVRLAAGSTWASVALHAGINTLPVVVGPGLAKVEGFNVARAEVAHLPPWLSLGGLAAGLALTLAATWRVGRGGRGV